MSNNGTQPIQFAPGAGVMAGQQPTASYPGQGYQAPQNLPTYQPNQGGAFAAWNTQQQPTMRPGPSSDWNTNMFVGQNSLGQGPAWAGAQNGYYLNQPQNSNPSQYGRWNWLGSGQSQQPTPQQPQQPAPQQPAPQQPAPQQPAPQQPQQPTPNPYTTPQPDPRFPNWNGIPGTAGDPWISGSNNAPTQQLYNPAFGLSEADYFAALNRSNGNVPDAYNGLR